MKNTFYKKIYILIISFIILFSGIHVFALDLQTKDYVPLEGNAFKGVDLSPNNNDRLGTFLGAVFNWGIAIAVVLTLIMIIWGGIEYMTTDSWGGKEEGRKKITDALKGLGLALVSYLILYTINPCLVVWTAKDGCNNTFLHPTGGAK